MLLKRLCEYAERVDLAPPMYQETPIRWLIELDDQGKFLGFVATTGGAGERKDRGKRFFAPHVGRSSGVRAKLLADTGEYVLGIPRPGSDEQRVADCHRAFVEQVRDCACKTREKSVEAVQKFLEQLPTSSLQLPDDFDPGDNLTFRVQGVLPIELEAIQKYWADVADPGSGGDPKTYLTCLVCGKTRPTVRRLPFKIKGVPGGQSSGMALISANVPAFESYGLEESLIAPTCPACGERFTKAANALIQGEKTRLTVGPLLYIFWTREEGSFHPALLLSHPESEEVRTWLQSAFSGSQGTLALDAQAFFATALSASGGRVAVRDWLETTVGKARQNLARWFRLQKLVDSDGSPGVPFGVYDLARSTVRESKDLSPNVPRVLLQAALRGGPLPHWLLYQVIKRTRAEQRITRPRAALIKMVLLSQALDDQMEDTMTELSITNTSPAYLCGRLLAVLESAQKAALPGINATLTDRFYGTASTAPAAVFSRLLRGTQAHLGKLRRDKPATHQALQRRLEEILEALPTFPRVLTLEEQGLFGLGYYHQRASDRAEAIARSKAREQDDETKEDN